MCVCCDRENGESFLPSFFSVSSLFLLFCISTRYICMCVNDGADGGWRRRRRFVYNRFWAGTTERDERDGERGKEFYIFKFK